MSRRKICSQSSRREKCSLTNSLPRLCLPRLTTATRSGNKKVTLVNNLETYHIDPLQFAHKCQVGLSVGTSQHPAPHRKSGTEVVIQGNHVAFAGSLLLEEYQVPKKYIKGLENATKPKKHK